MFELAKKIFGTKNARVMKAMRPIVDHIGSLEEGLKAKSDSELQAMTFEFRRRLGMMVIMFMGCHRSTPWSSSD